tara:strand:- start:172 stop:1797 length:1626 start_codon:yes stop_codon:yes gene_type:complete
MEPVALPAEFDFSNDCWLLQLPDEVLSMITDLIVQGTKSEFLVATGKFVDDTDQPPLRTMHPCYDTVVGGYAINGTFYMTDPPKPDAPTRSHSMYDGPDCNKPQEMWLTYTDPHAALLREGRMRPISEDEFDTVDQINRAGFGPRDGPNDHMTMVRPASTPMQFNTFAQIMPRGLDESMWPGHVALQRQKDTLRSAEESGAPQEETDELRRASNEFRLGLAQLWAPMLEHLGDQLDLRLRITTGEEEFHVVEERHDTRDIVPRGVPENRARIERISQRKQTVMSLFDSFYLPIDESEVKRGTGRLTLLTLSKDKRLQIKTPPITIHARLPMMARLDPAQIEDEFTHTAQQQYSISKYLMIVPLLWVRCMAMWEQPPGSPVRLCRDVSQVWGAPDDGPLWDRQCMRFVTKARAGDPGCSLPTATQLRTPGTHGGEMQDGLYRVLRLQCVPLKKITAMMVDSFYAFNNRFPDLTSVRYTTQLLQKADDFAWRAQNQLDGPHVLPPEPGRAVRSMGMFLSQKRAKQLSSTAADMFGVDAAMDFL